MSATTESSRTESSSRPSSSTQFDITGLWAQMPWWLLIIILADLFIIYAFFTDKTYSDAFNFIKGGIWVTISVTLSAYAIAVTIGLITGLARVSKNPIIYNIATLYVQVMRGVPILVTIIYIAFVGVPLAFDALKAFGGWLADINLLAPDNWFATLNSRDIDFVFRAIIALAISYGAFSSEIFRAGIESIGRGQMEAARSLGMNYFQAMRYIILPQAVRRVLPPLGNDFIAMLKESSLVSALGVRDITQLGRLHSASTFRYLETFNVIVFLYLTMTIILSLGVKALERKMKVD
jgi:polar amino acid transport system permease protein